MLIRSTFVMLMTAASLISASTAQAAASSTQAPKPCAGYPELAQLAQSIQKIQTKPEALPRSAKSQLVGVLDGGWLIATALGDHTRAHCFAELSDTLGLLPAQPMTGDETKLEKVPMPEGLASHVHEAAMQVIRRL